jgi:hypothetical protein
MENLIDNRAKLAVNVLLVVAIAFVLYYVLKTFKGVGEAASDITSGAAEVAHEATTNVSSDDAQAAVDLAKKALEKTSQKPTKTDIELKSIANAIFDAGRVYNVGGMDVDEMKIYRELTKLQNDADLLRLIVLFGTKYRYTFGVPTRGKFSLIEFVKDVLGDTMYPVKATDGKKYKYIDVINANWKRKKPAMKILL